MESVVITFLLSQETSKANPRSSGEQGRQVLGPPDEEQRGRQEVERHEDQAREGRL